MAPNAQYAPDGRADVRSIHVAFDPPVTRALRDHAAMKPRVRRRRLLSRTETLDNDMAAAASIA